MKRSEAVRQLAGHLSCLQQFRNEHPESLVPLAQSALTFIEFCIEMKPPMTFGYKESKSGLVIDKKSLAYAWEPES